MIHATNGQPFFDNFFSWTASPREGEACLPVQLEKKKKSYPYLHVCHLNRNVASFRVTSSFNCGNFTCSNWRLESLIGLTATFFFMEALSLILFITYLSFSFSSLLVELELAWRRNARHSNDKESRDFNRNSLTTCNYSYLFLSICLMQHSLPTRNSFQ